MTFQDLKTKYQKDYKGNLTQAMIDLGKEELDQNLHNAVIEESKDVINNDYAENEELRLHMLGMAEYHKK